jgi:signal transduction histidine kinase
MILSGRRRKTIAFFVTFGICLVAVAVFLNITWIVLNWRAGLMLFFGVLFFLIIISGVVLNTIFLVREIRRNDQHDSFINAVTHELKTPIASIRLYLDTLRTRQLDERKRQEFYEIMAADSDRLLQTVEQVLRAGSSGSRMGRRHLRTRIDLGQMVEECVALARTRYHLTPDALSYVESIPAGERPVVLGDLDSLKAAVSNLIDNAIKYSGQQIRVFVETVKVDTHRVAVRVTDHGVGISSAELKRIFKRFYRIPAVIAMRVKGSGLGLYIVRSVARAHGGRAYAESQGPGHGSTFTLQLPLAPPV